MLAAMLFFTSMSVFIRLASEELHWLQIVFLRNFLAVLLMVPWVLRLGLSVMYTRRIGLLTLRSMINVVGMALGFAAITMIPLAEATSVIFLAPLLVTALSVPLLIYVRKSNKDRNQL